MACHGTHQGRPWHAMAPPRQAKESHGSHQGRPWLATAPPKAGHGMPRHTKASCGMPLTSVCSANGHATTPFHQAHQGSNPRNATARTKAGHGMPWSPPWQANASQGRPWHATTHTKAGHGMPLTSVCSAHGHATVPTPWHASNLGL
jgi:hypothetical protein